MKYKWLLFFSYLLLSSSVWAKEKPPEPIDQLYLYMEQDTFREDKCLAYLKGVYCASTSEKLNLYAEYDGPQGFVLNIHERPDEDLPFRVAMIKVMFHPRGGIELMDVTNFYADYPPVRRGKEIQVVVRRWLRMIQKTIQPNFRFAPLE